MFKNMVGKYVIVRADKAGVFFGKLKEVTEDGYSVVLEDTRKLWYWDGAAAVQEIAVHGVTRPDNCNFTVFVKEACVIGVCEIIPCTDEAIECIKNVKIWQAKEEN